jgi:alkylhydroperoxidase/carboxymuconolactone decarboxylase family protein YurZ
MARAFDFLHATNEVLTSRDIELPQPGQSTTTPETRQARGLEVQRQLLGERIDQMYAQSPKDQLHIQRYLSANCFGDFLTRTGLDLKTRELLTLAMLASLGGCESQLAGHVTANLAAGNGRKTLIAVVTHLLPFIGYPRTLNAIRVINEGTAQEPGFEAGSNHRWRRARCRRIDGGDEGSGRGLRKPCRRHATPGRGHYRGDARRWLEAARLHQLDGYLQ